MCLCACLPCMPAWLDAWMPGWMDGWTDGGREEVRRNGCACVCVCVCARTHVCMFQLLLGAFQLELSDSIQYSFWLGSTNQASRLVNL